MESGASQTGSSSSGSPESGSPESGSPESGSPESGSPESGSPESGSPESGSPESGFPAAGFPAARGSGSWLSTLAVMAVAAAAVAAFISVPNMVVLAGGVLAIAGVAYYSERNPAAGSDRVLLARKAVLVTGCDTGLGHALALRLSRLGVLTFAGCLHACTGGRGGGSGGTGGTGGGGLGAMRLREEKNPALHVLQLDVTSDDQVAAAVEEIKSKLGKHVLWGVVNNAGLNFLGDVELTTMAQYEKCVQINQLGMVRVTKAVLPSIRAALGRVVNVSSVLGTFSPRLDAAYSATKFAAEAFSDALRREMRDFGVKVAVIQPCNFGGATESLNTQRLKQDFEEMWAGASEEVREAYGREYLDQHEDIVEESAATACQDVRRVTDAMLHALFATKPNTRYLVPGGSGWIDIYWVRSKLVHYLPTSWFDAWLRQDWSGKRKPRTADID